MTTQYAATTVLDEALGWAIALLLAISLVMVYSASIAYAQADAATQNRYYFLIRHAIFMVIGLACGYVTFQIPTPFWQKYAGKLFLLGVLMLVLVLIPGIGRVVNGSRRWISLFVINLQPSELMKFATVIYAADYTVRKSHKLHSLKEGFLPMFVAMVVVAFLLLREPDFGALMVVMSIAMGVLFLGGINLRIFSGLAAMAVVAIVLLIVSSPYRLKRVLGFMDPWDDPFGKGYQLSHSLIAARGPYRLHSGGDRRRVRLPRNLRADRPVRLDRASRVSYRRRVEKARTLLPGAGGARHGHLARNTGVLQYRRQHGSVADQGADPAADVIRRLGHVVQPDIDGRAAAHRL
jgi:membrane protein YdbS with pleckstrin-like domain